MPVVEPKTVPSPRAALGYDGIRYEVLRTRANRRLLVTGEDQLHSFRDTLEIHVTGNPSGADGYLVSPPVPAGDLWVITNVVADDDTRNLTSIHTCRWRAAAGYCFGCVARAIPATERVCWAGWQWAKAGDTIRAYLIGSQAADTCHMWITGHRMSLEGEAGMYGYYVHVQDQKAQNTSAGGFTLGAWRTRDINTELDDTGAICAIAANQITLQPGTYRCLITCPAFRVDAHQSRLQDITGGATLLTGSSEQSSNADGVQNRSVISGRFTLAVASVLEVQHQCQTTVAVNGFGVAANFTTEVYTDAEFWWEFD